MTEQPRRSAKSACGASGASPTPVGADGFLMYRADQDKSWAIPRIESVEEWLEANEAEHGGPAALQFGAQGGS